MPGKSPVADVQGTCRPLEARLTMILHIDMDAFFASVEQRDRPELRGKCVIVGGKSERAVVTTASYEARRYGVRSAMPMFEARRRCPHAIIVPGRMAHYKNVSGQIMRQLRDFTPLVEPVSIDEAYLDVSGARRLFGSPERIAQSVKSRIWQTTGLTCSIGAAPLRFLAKIASDMDKPDGLTIIRADEMPAFIAQLPLRKIPGVGKVTQDRLKRLNLVTLGDVHRFPQDVLIRRLGKFGHRLAALARGEDPTPVTPHTAVKSVSSEMTLDRDTRNRAILLNILRQQAEDVGNQLRRRHLKARTVTLKLKHTDFQQVTRSKTFDQPIQTATTIYQQAEALLQHYPLHRQVRLIGVGASHFVDAQTPVQAELFPAASVDDTHWTKIDATLDAINAKFGHGFIGKASRVAADKKTDRDPD
jgi:DNA polymerase-4